MILMVSFLWGMAWVNPHYSLKGKAGLWDPFELSQASKVISEPYKIGGVAHPGLIRAGFLLERSGLAEAGREGALEGF